MPADSTSAAHYDDREFGTSRWQLCCYILLKFAYTRKGANVASWHDSDEPITAGYVRSWGEAVMPTSRSK